MAAKPTTKPSWKSVSFNLDASTTTDAGVTLGGRVRITSQEEFGATGAADSGSRVNGARLFAQYQGLTVAVGNILGAIESFPALYTTNVGLTGLGFYDNLGAGPWDAYTSAGKGAEGVEVIYKGGPLSAHLSYSSNEFSNSRAGDAETLAAHVAYVYEGWTFGLAAQEAKGAPNNSSDLVLASVQGAFGDFGVTFVGGKASATSASDKETFLMLGGTYTVGATKLTGYVADWDNVYANTTFGLGAAYALGGGASLVGGVVRTPAKDTRADLGVSFRF
jgi:outer membrane protein OmpU